MRPLRATIRLCRRRVLATLICATAAVGPARTAAAQAGPGRESTLTAPAPSADSLLKRIDALESRVDTVSSVAAWAVDMRNNGLVILSFIGGVLLLFLLFDLWSGRDVTFDSHWGGFGSGTGGFHRLLSAGTPAGSAPLPDALSGFAAAFRFAALSAEAVEARFDRAWRELQQWVAVDEVSWPSVSHETFADYGAQLAATLAKVAATDPRFSLATLQTAAWNSVSTRYLGTLSGSEPEASIEELICWRFGVPPSQIPSRSLRLRRSSGRSCCSERGAFARRRRRCVWWPLTRSAFPRRATSARRRSSATTPRRFWTIIRSCSGSRASADSSCCARTTGRSQACGRRRRASPSCRSHTNRPRP